MFDPEKAMAADPTAQALPLRIIRVRVTRDQAVRRMQAAGWDERTVELILKEPVIEAAIPIGGCRLKIVE